MPELFFPYGKDKLSYQISEEFLAGVITASIHDYKAVCTGYSSCRRI